ncbi:hypothetical protein B9G98_03641 [Wickerhamiella sorbophila]|uniref:Nuclear segregation protein BFR1 n=1 Tax=Wickerhamiella sorbophila TaxID=45607 RepID=A0A2T0FM05_9ASCO|nr:hypothetical protein B9G98_03641 [Wickerhamiella sorbophila]PRT56021.1 hypothetical protein B9G98_03641 [Wickerhamiella sorbophila]
MSAEQKIVRPDRAEFDKTIEELKKQLEQQRAIQNKAKATIDATQGDKGPDAEWNKLIEEVKEARKVREAAHAKLQSKLKEIKAVESSVQKKLKDIQALRPKNGAKNEQELDAQIQRLEREADSGNFSLVEEKKVLKEITSLKNSRRSFAAVTKLQADIDADRAKIAELRKSVDDSELKAAQTKLNGINKQLDERKASRQSQRSQLDSVWTERKAAMTEIKKINAAMDKAREEFNTKQAAFRQQAIDRKKAREQEEKDRKVAAEKAKKLATAEAKLESAKLPAFAEQIAKAEALLAFFDPSFKGSSAASSNGSAQTSGLVSTRAAPRQVEAVPDNAQVLSKCGPDVMPSRKERKRKTISPKPDEGKLRLDVGIIGDLAALNIALPGGSDDVENTKKSLLEKIEYYKENDKRVTKERVERAEAELAKIKASSTEETEETAEETAEEPTQ